MPRTPDGDFFEIQEFWSMQRQLYDDVYSVQIQQMRDDAKYYKLEHTKTELKIPDSDNISMVIPPTARVMIDTAAAHLVTAFPMIHYPMRDVKPEKILEERRRVESIRAFGESFIYKARMGTTRMNPYESSAKDLLLYGKAIHSVMPNEGIIVRDRPLDPERWPFVVDSISPMSIMEDPDGDPPRWVLRAKRMTYDMLLNRYDFIDEDTKNNILRNNAYSGNVFDWATIWEAWTENTVQWFDQATQMELYRSEHNWGFHPFNIVHSGFGIKEEDYYDWAPGVNTKYQMPREYMAVGLMTYVRKGGILDAEIVTASQVRKLMNDASWTDYIVDDTLYEAFDPGRGNVYEYHRNDPSINMDDLVVPIQGRFPDATLMQYQSQVQQEALSATAPKAVQGIREPGVTAASHQAQIAAQAKLRYGPPHENMTRLMQMDLAKAGELHERVIKKPLDVYNGLPNSPAIRTLKPEDWGGFYDFMVKLQAGDDLERDQAIVAASRAAEVGMSPVTILGDYANVQNPQEELIERGAWDLVNSEQGQQMMTDSLAELWQMEAADMVAKRGGGKDLTPIGPVPQGGQGDPTAALQQLAAEGGLGTNSAEPGSPVDQGRQIRQNINPSRGKGRDLPKMARRGR